MKAIILCGGKGNRIQSSETGFLPKPLVSIGGIPMIYHILNWYSSQGIDEFIIALGDRSREIREAWKWNQRDITFVETGDPDSVQTGGRLRRIYDKYPIRDNFLLGYCDVLSNFSLADLTKAHYRWGSLLTLTLANPMLPFGVAQFQDSYLESDGMINYFAQKPILDDMWVNEGIYVVDPRIIEYIESDDVEFDAHLVPYLSQEGKVSAYKHQGFWMPVNTVSDWDYANESWALGNLNWLKKIVCV